MNDSADKQRGVGWFLKSLAPRLYAYRLACAALVVALIIDDAFDAIIPLSLKFLIVSLSRSHFLRLVERTPTMKMRLDAAIAQRV